MRILLTGWILFATSVANSEEKSTTPLLSPRNTEVPFCYRHQGRREWPIIYGQLSDADSVKLSARRDDKELAAGKSLTFSGLTISITASGWLRIESDGKSDPQTFQLVVRLSSANKTTTQQTLQVRPAPPNRPISYLSDLVDELIRIYYDSKSGRFRPIDKPGFDQYFRRLQAQGIARLIVWQSPFPFATDPNEHRPEEWASYEQQAHAILESQELKKVFATAKLPSWKWMSMTMALRLDPGFGKRFAQSATDHGIKLAGSFRPFEPALTKYYEIPTFDSDGRWLWGFLPAAWPGVNYRPEDYCFANYRTILKSMERKREAEPASLIFTDVDDAESFAKRIASGKHGLRIVASHFPPIADDSFVLVRQQQRFVLQRYREIAERTRQHQIELSGFRVSVSGRSVRIDGLNVPHGIRYLKVSRATANDAMPRAVVGTPIRLLSQAGNQLGRVNIYRVADASDPDANAMRIAGITSDGMYRTTFQAIESSIDKLGAKPESSRLEKVSYVIDLGADWSVEMLDFQKPATRKLAVTQLKSFLKHSAYDEIFINTRTHCQLAATEADAYAIKGGIERLEKYRLGRQNYRHLGIDRAFAPISLAKNDRMRQLAASKDTIEKITTWQDDEWNEPCQSPDSPFVWRYERNSAVAAGLRELFQELEREFPGVRIRAVIPPNETVIRTVRKQLDRMPKPDGGNYGSEYFRHVRGSLNHIPAIGEGMAMVDLSGLSVEPVFLGIRFAPDSGPIDAYLNQCFAALRNNYGSRFRGSRSFFYEAQETLRAAYREKFQSKREQIICNLLSRREEIREVILYEAADWTYYIPISDVDYCSSNFLDRCLKPIK